MTYKYGRASMDKLATCHPKLQQLCLEIIKHRDVTILYGHRGEHDQNELFDQGKSKKKYPDSKHNSLPSRAVDMAFYPIDWNDLVKWEEFKEFVKDTAKKLNIDIIAGGDWKTFKDYPHFQLGDNE